VGRVSDFARVILSEVAGSGLIAAAPVRAGYTRQARRRHAAQPFAGTLREIDGGRPLGATQNRVRVCASRELRPELADQAFVMFRRSMKPETFFQRLSQRAKMARDFGQGPS
jgi:hypothetical protein